LSGKDALGNTEALTNDTISEVTSDPSIATVTANPADATVIAIDGLLAGQCTITINLTNADGVAAQPTVLNITVLPQDVVEVDVAQIGGEGKVGDPFPTNLTK